MSNQNLDEKKEISVEQANQEQSKISDKFKIPEEPQLFPNLRKNVLNLDKYIASQSSKNQIGSFGIILNNLRKKSIYKKLLLDFKKDQNNSNFQLKKEIRNNYLKKLVESNSFYFPKELALDEYKKPNNPKEDKYNKNLKFMEEVAKKEKKNLDLLSNKNSSMNLIKESLLDNKIKRADSIYEEINKKKKKKKKKISEVNEENEEKEEDNYIEENEREPSYNDNEEYGQNEDHDSQNCNYSFDEGDDDDY